MNIKLVTEYKGGFIMVQSFVGGTDEVTYQVSPFAYKQKASSVSVAKGKITNAIKAGKISSRKFYKI